MVIKKGLIIHSELTDNQIAGLINKSDQNAFKELFYRYYDPLYMFCYRRTQSSDLSADLVQDVFMRLWQNRSKLDLNRSIKSYLYQGAQNSLIDYYRKRKTRQEFLQQKSSENPITQIDETFDIEETINDALKKLPEELRTVFFMNRFDGLKYREIAESLEISVKTVESRMTKALKLLRKLLNHLLLIIVYLLGVKDYLICFLRKYIG